MAVTPRLPSAGPDQNSDSDLPIPKRRPATPQRPIQDDVERLRQNRERPAGSDPYKTDWGGQYGSDTPGHYGSDEHGEDNQPEPDNSYKTQPTEPIYDEPGVYQPEEEAQTTPTGGDKSWRDRLGMGRRRDKEPLDRGGLKGRELAGSQAAKDSSAIPPAERSFYKPTAESADSGKFKLRNLFNTRRKKLLGGGGIVGTIIALFFGFSIIQGPLQLVHLSQILGRNFFGNEQTTVTRSKGLFRFARTGDIGETRLTKTGSIFYRKTISKLGEIGITFERNSYGVPKSMTIDPAKYPDYKGLTRAQQKAAFIRDFSINSDRSFVAAIRDGPDGRLLVKLDDASLKGMKFSNMLLKTSIAKLGDGKIATYMNIRFTRDAFALPKLFSPLTNRLKAQASKRISAIERKNLEKQRQAELQKPIAEKTGVARAKVKNFLQSNKGKFTTTVLGSGLLASSLICEFRSIADDVVTANRGALVLPGVVNIVDKMAVGGQIQSGQGGFTSAEAGAVADSLIDENGQSIWQAKALQVTAGEPNPTGPDLPKGIGAAFSGNTTADKILDETNISILGVNICSKTGQILQVTTGLGLLALGAISFGGSWGLFAAQQTAVIAATATAFVILHEVATPLLEEKAVIPEVLSGPLGGNIMAYSAREAANIASRASGGTPLSETESAMLDSQLKIAEQQEFDSKSPLSKVFDVYDRRSAAGKLIDNTNLNMATIRSSVLNFGLAFSSLTKIFSPPAQAETEPYNWGFPRYGIPQSLAEDPRYQDPYDNAEQVAQLLKNNDSYIDRAKNCFGVEISTSDWSVVAKDDVNPGDSSYTHSTCDDGSDEWNRIRLFIADSRIMDAQACYELNDATACQNVGFNELVNPSTTTSSATTTIDSLGGQQLAPNPQRWIQWIAQNVMPNLPGNADAKAEMAARVTWWSLKESVLDLPKEGYSENPIGYNNCSPTGNEYKAFLDDCDGISNWQAGIAAVRPAENDEKAVADKALELHPGQSHQEIMGRVAIDAGYHQGSNEYNQAANATGRLKHSLLMRDPATGFVFSYPKIAPCLTEQARAALKTDWCQGYGSAAHVAKDVPTTLSVIAELKAYFKNGGSTTIGPIPTGSAQELAKQILSYKDDKYSCENEGDCTDLEYTAAGKSLAGIGYCRATAIDVKVLQLMLALIKSGYSIGTYALCSDHESNADKSRHNVGFAVDISSINGKPVNSSSAYQETLAVMKLLNSLAGTALAPDQALNQGAGSYSAELDALSMNDGKVTGLFYCEKYGKNLGYTGCYVGGHMNHIHVGY